MVDKIKKHKDIEQLNLKGSFLYGNFLGSGVGKDIDFECVVRNLSEMSDVEIKQKLLSMLEIETDKVNIYRNEDRIFTVSIEYGDMNFTFYDSKLPRIQEHDWACNVDALRYDLIGNEGLSFSPEYQEFCRLSSGTYDKELEFNKLRSKVCVINDNSYVQDRFFRIAYYLVKDVISYPEIDNKKYSEMLLDDLRIYKDGMIQSKKGFYENIIKNVENFVS